MAKGLRWCKEELKNLYTNTPNRKVRGIMKNYQKSVYKVVKALIKCDRANLTTTIDICENLVQGITPFAISNGIFDWGYSHLDNQFEYFKHKRCDYLYKVMKDGEAYYHCDKRFKLINIHSCKCVENFYQHDNKVISKCLNDIFKITFPYNYRNIIILEEHFSLCHGTIQFVRFYHGNNELSNSKAIVINKCFKITYAEQEYITEEITVKDFENAKAKSYIEH